jgi:hypothetical protein
VALVTTKTGSLENVTVTVPLAVAVPTLVRVPVELNAYTVSPTTMLGSVMVRVIGDVDAGDVPADCQVTATDVTYDCPEGISASSAVVVVMGYTLTTVPVGRAPVGTTTVLTAEPDVTTVVSGAPAVTLPETGVP